MKNINPMCILDKIAKYKRYLLYRSIMVEQARISRLMSRVYKSDLPPRELHMCMGLVVQMLHDEHNRCYDVRSQYRRMFHDYL
jgi:hypothetical protein